MDAQSPTGDMTLIVTHNLDFEWYHVLLSSDCSSVGTVLPFLCDSSNN